MDAHAEQYTGISMSSDSSPSSSSSSEPVGMQEVDATGTKRERENDNGSDEGERLLRLAAMCAALGGPHEENNFMEAPPSEDELYEARCRELKQLIDFDVFEEISPEDLPKETRVITTTWVDRRKTPTEVKSRICARDFNTGKRDLGPTRRCEGRGPLGGSVEGAPVVREARSYFLFKALYRYRLVRPALVPGDLPSRGPAKK